MGSELTPKFDQEALQRILQRKREEVEQRRDEVPQAELQARTRAALPARGFADAMRAKIAAGRPARPHQARCADDQLVSLEPPFKNGRGEFLRAPDGSIAWMRFLSRIAQRQ